MECRCSLKCKQTSKKKPFNRIPISNKIWSITPVGNSSYRQNETIGRLRDEIENKHGLTTRISYSPCFPNACEDYFYNLVLPENE